MNEILIRAKDLAYTYPFQEKPAISGISFELRRGEAMLVTGPSGCGKSTLLRILNGLAPEHFRGTLTGSLEIAGLPSGASLEEISRHVGTVLQCPEEQIMATTVEEEVALELEWRSTPPDEMRRLVDDSLRVLDLTNLARRSVFNLSSGERQKCVIASVLAAKADIAVMDEPTANLSPEATEDLAGIVQRLKDMGVAVVIVDHRLYWLKGVVDKVIVLNNGKIAAAENTLEALAAHADIASLGLRRIDVARPALPAVSEIRDAEATVAIRDLTFRYSRRDRFIYENFSASLPHGRITAIVGANGAGKTTLARLVCGLLKPRTGEILLAGKTARRRDLRQRVAFVMQQMDIQLYMKTVEDELVYSAPRRIGRHERRADASRWMDVFGLSHLAKRHPHSLSGGEKQRLVIACALMKRPDLMILDEPTSGLDGRNMALVARELKSYVSAGGTVLLITHDLELLRLVADCELVVGS